MPFDVDNPPDKVKGLSKNKQRQWVEVFNSCWKEHHDDKKCHMMAWGVVKKEGSMSRFTKIAAKVVKASFRDDAKYALMFGLRVPPHAVQVLEQYLTYTEGTSNKFHYFGVWVDRKTGEAVGGNSYGRIGTVPKSIEIARGNKMSVTSAIERKVRAKLNKGYEPSGW